MKLFLFLSLFFITSVSTQAKDGLEEINCSNLDKSHKNYVQHTELCTQTYSQLKKIQWSMNYDTYNNIIILNIYSPDFNQVCHVTLLNQSNQVIRKYRLGNKNFFANIERQEVIQAPTLNSFINQVTKGRLEPCEFYLPKNYSPNIESEKKTELSKKNSYSMPSIKTTQHKQPTNSLPKQLFNKVFK